MILDAAMLRVEVGRDSQQRDYMFFEEGHDATIEQVDGSDVDGGDHVLLRLIFAQPNPAEPTRPHAWGNGTHSLRQAMTLHRGRQGAASHAKRMRLAELLCLRAKNAVSATRTLGCFMKNKQFSEILILLAGESRI
ncbi:MAG: hypothetical protein P1U77_27820 [Rubripirellula sp.]|nr:hypothetical protein [Rubripirellula sp.]